MLDFDCKIDYDIYSESCAYWNLKNPKKAIIIWTSVKIRANSQSL